MLSWLKYTNFNEKTSAFIWLFKVLSHILKLFTVIKVTV